MQPRIPFATRGLLPVLLVLTSTSIASAQLSGSYSVDGSKPTSASNFNTFEDATKTLFIQGMSGAVDLNILPGTYNESIIVLPSGSDATKPLTFRSVVPLPGQVNLTSPDHIVLLFPGLTAAYSIDSVYFEGLDFLSTAARGYAIWGNEKNTNIRFTKCTMHPGVQGHGTSPTSTLVRYVFIDGRDTATNWQISHCTFNYATLTTSSTTYGIYGSQIRNFEIFSNTFNYAGQVKGIYLINSNNAQNRIYNNLFLGKLGNSNSAAAVSADASNFANEIAGNTFDLDIPNAAGHAVRTMGTSSYHNRIYGNIFNVIGTGGGIFVYNSASLSHFSADGNLFNVQSGLIGTVSGTPYTTLASWQTGTSGGPTGAQDTNSLVGDPQFVAAGNYRLKPASPAIGKAKEAGVNGFVLATDFDGLFRGTQKDIGAFELTGFEIYGIGCPGTGNKIPELLFGGELAAGQQFQILLDNAKASSPAFLSIGLAKASIPIGGSCELLNSGQIVIGLTTDAMGQISVPLTVPTTSQVTGLHVYMQWGVVDAAAAGVGLATSNGGAARF